MPRKQTRIPRLLGRKCISNSHIFVFLLVVALALKLEQWREVVETNNAHSGALFVDAFAAGGGFGGGGFGAKTNIKKASNNKQKKKRQSLSQLNEPTKTTTKPSTEAKGPKLDKWGLPPTTLEDIFPPLPDSTELEPVDSSKEYDVSEIQECLKDHVDLGDLTSVFDDRGIAKIPNKDGSAMRLRLLHRSPPVLSLDNFLTEEECSEIKLVAQEETSAHRVDSATFTGALSTRTSTSWFCNYSDVPVLLAKAYNVLGVPLETMEEPQIVRYKGGEEFSWHYDEVPSPQLPNGGQRVATLLVYLSTIPSSRGGGTTFRDLNESSSSSVPLAMQPQRGSALLFFPSFADGTPDDRTLHKSEILASNETDNEHDHKWIVQMWTHQKEYQAALPIGNSNEAARQIMEETSAKLGYKM